MTNIYIILLDVTRERTDQQQMRFIKALAFHDLSKYIVGFAKSNNTSTRNIRLYVAETKKKWEEMNKEFVKRAYFRPAEENAEPLFG